MQSLVCTHTHNNNESSFHRCFCRPVGIVIAIAVLFFLIVAGAFLGFVAVWSCRN